MLYVALHLHAYQPPTQKEFVLEQIFEECYEPLIRTAEEWESVRFSLDIAKSLGERLPQDFWERIRNLWIKERIEILNTAAYHYILPLVPVKTLDRQLALNLDFYTQALGKDQLTLKGVFPPELAVSPNVIRAIRWLGYKWILADDAPFVSDRFRLPEKERAPQDWIPSMHGVGILLRSRLWSNRIASNANQTGGALAQNLIESQKQWSRTCGNNNDNYLVLAMDAETFNHWHKDAIKNFLIPFFEHIADHPKDCQTAPLDFIYHQFPKRPEYMPAGSWSTTSPSVPFPLWSHPQNEFHRIWNEFVDLTLEQTPSDANLELQNLLDRAFYSCTPWQYSCGNMGVSRWCMPMFEEIVERLSNRGDTKILLNLLAQMKELLKT